MLPTKQATAAALALVALFLCCSIGVARAQENIQLQIPPSLVECYNTSYFMNRANRLPATIETLISLIEKVENTQSYNSDMRTLTVALLQRFRQDGIQRAPNVVQSPGVIPYSPTGFQFPKFRILLSRLIPGNAFNFPNSTLSREERCSLHFMLSSTIDTRVRGDENQVCNQLSQYRAQRLPRDTAKHEQSNFMGDVELLENMRPRATKSIGSNPYIQPRPGYDVDFGYESGYAGPTDNTISQCPVENGVMWTPWGTVAAGTLLAGIAAGLQPQTVQLRTLLALSRRGPGGQSLAQTATVYVDNRWAATLAGDLAEVALVQVPTSPTETAVVGASGVWNSTVMPKWYFLSQRQNLEMTDAEIRGGLDGLILAMNIQSWRTQASNMKLSQLLRMYYSMDGVLGSNIMACNRKDQFATVAPEETMIAQTSAFAQVLDREMQLRVTLSPNSIAQFSTSAAKTLESYVPQYLSDVSCAVSSALPQDVTQSVTPMTNIYVFLDTTWQYPTVVDYVTYVLARLNINPYASSVTLLAAADGSIIVNTTNYLNDIYEGWNQTTQSMYAQGFSLPTVLRTVQNLTQNLMNGQRTNSTVGGRSLIALCIPYNANVDSGDSSYSLTQLQYIHEQIPDLHFIYYTGGSINRFAPFVLNPSQDLYPLNSGGNVAASSAPVVLRIKQIPRQIINPRCGSNFYTSTWGTDQMAQYARPGVVNFYRMMPNYFFGAGGGRYVNVQSQNGLQFTVCSSRTTVLPVQNSTSTTGGDQNCVPIGSGFAYDLSSACNGYKTIHECPPLYLSVQSPQLTNGNPQTVSCSDAACQTPDAAKYIISVVNLGCYSGVAGLFASFATIVMAYVLVKVLQ